MSAIRFVLLTSVFGIAVPVWAADQNVAVKAILHRHGAKLVINSASSDFEALVETCSDAINSAPNGSMTELLVLPTTIRDIENNGDKYRADFSQTAPLSADFWCGRWQRHRSQSIVDRISRTPR